MSEIKRPIKDLIFVSMGLQALSMTQGPEESTNPSNSKGSDSYDYENSQDTVIQRTLLSTDSLATDHETMCNVPVQNTDML